MHEGAVMAVNIAKAKNAETVVNILTEGFADDAVIRWIYPGEQEYRSLAPAFFKYMFDHTLAVGEALLDADGRGVLLTEPVSPSGAGREHGRSEIQTIGGNGDCADRLASYMFGGADVHPMEESHWYWSFGSVLPSSRGIGVGRSLFRRSIRDKGEPIYGEATSHRNLSLYERLGARKLFEWAHPDGPSSYAFWIPRGAEDKMRP
ncbi:GNAT family N-acetyltransferase [Streptomyces sp. L2]|uniref:GNAT family N-acetyltransferase n=1 Tax=Streptomyces sp. L2 TaxID=2162665 RepID=UPI001010F0AB|nr:GNAT family N-acetyltransferase [Streptomyces sp. L2]